MIANALFAATGFLLGAATGAVIFALARKRLVPEVPPPAPVLDPSIDAALQALAHEWAGRRNTPEATGIVKECMRELLLFGQRQASSRRRVPRV